MGVGGNLHLVVDSNEVGLVSKFSEPLLGEGGVPWSVDSGRIGRRDPRAIGKQTVTGVSIVRVEGLLGWSTIHGQRMPMDSYR